MRALVISGGGSKGAFAGGVVDYLTNECHIQYELYVGTSTGSLLLPHIAIGELEKIKNIYTNIAPKDIFDVNPFRTKGDSVLIHHFNIIRMFFRKQKTFGSSKNLLKTIKNNFSKEDFKKLQQSNKSIIVSVANLTNFKMEYKNSKLETYDDFCDWVWISANEVPFMSLVTKNGCDYADGGFGSLTPINEAIKQGATEIDVIVLNPRENKDLKGSLSNPFQTFFRAVDFMHNQISKDDIRLGELEANIRSVNINFYYVPRKLTNNSLIFNATQMKEWWVEGYEYAKKSLPFCHVVEPKTEQISNRG